MAQVELIMPKMGESVHEATIIKWLKNEGDKIALDEPLLEIATDKVDSEIPSTAEGTLTKKLFKDGDVVQVGKVIAIISSSAFESVSSSPSVTPAVSKKQTSPSKNGESIMKHLLYTINELKQHLEFQFEPWMNWNNQGRYIPENWDDNDENTWKWQLDHIIPQSDLPYSSMEDDNFKKCWSLNNLRPYSAKQNLLDGVNRIRHKAA